MSPLLAPLLAQLIDLRVADRTEARYVKYVSQRNEGGTNVNYDSERYEGTTNPKATLSLADRRFNAFLAYGPRLTLEPLETTPRYLLVFHEASAAAGYSWRHSSLTLSSFLGVGDINFRFFGVQGLSPAATQPTATDGGANMQGAMQQPTPGGTTTTPGGTTTTPGGTTTPNGTTQPQATDQNLRYYTSSTNLSFTHRPSKSVELGAQAGYNAAGGLTSQARFFYPVLRGFTAGVRAADVYTLSKADSFTGSVSFQQTWSSNGNRTGTFLVLETWGHRFAPRTVGSLGAGLNITRFVQADGLRGYSVFPAFTAALAHQLRLGRGGLAFSIFAYSAPALDPLRALVDPRLGAGANVTYTRGRYLLSLTGTAAFSLAPVDNNASAVDAAQAQALTSYRFGEALTLDGGLRYMRQAYRGATVIPDTWVGFVGVSVGLDVHLAGGRPR